MLKPYARPQTSANTSCFILSTKQTTYPYRTFLGPFVFVIHYSLKYCQEIFADKYVVRFFFMNEEINIRTLFQEIVIMYKWSGYIHNISRGSKNKMCIFSLSKKTKEKFTFLSFSKQYTKVNRKITFRKKLVSLPFFFFFFLLKKSGCMCTYIGSEKYLFFTEGKNKDVRI